MRILTVILIAILFTNCHRYALPQGSTRQVSTDSITITRVPYDSIIAIPGSTAMFVFPFPLVDSPYTDSQKTEGKEAIIDTHGGKLVVTCKTDSLKQVIQLLRTQISEKSYQGKDSIITVVQTVTKTKTSGVTWVSLVLNVLALVFVYVKAKSAILSPISWISNLFK